MEEYPFGEFTRDELLRWKQRLEAGEIKPPQGEKLEKVLQFCEAQLLKLAEEP